MEPIRIIHLEIPLDNYGKVKNISDPKEIYEVLNNPDKFIDDMDFFDSFGQRYLIDDLIGRRVILTGIPEFVVPSD